MDETRINLTVVFDQPLTNPEYTAHVFAEQLSELMDKEPWGMGFAKAIRVEALEIANVRD